MQIENKENKLYIVVYIYLYIYVCVYKYIGS